MPFLVYCQQSLPVISSSNGTKKKRKKGQNEMGQIGRWSLRAKVATGGGRRTLDMGTFLGPGTPG